MPIHYLKINTKMVCGGCSSTVEKALSALPGVSAVSVTLSSQSAKVDTSCADSIACDCSKTPDGKCSCGDVCKCMVESLINACEAVGFDAVAADASVHQCGSTDKKGPCGSPVCTCGDDCQCGPDGCKCAGCPGNSKASCGVGKGPCSSPNCNCGSDCQCGPNCTCSTCPKPKERYDANMTNVAVGVTLFAIGWMASKRFG